MKEKKTNNWKGKKKIENGKKKQMEDKKEIKK